MTYESLPPADPGREERARELFSMSISPELYAAREGHRWACFSLDDVQYSDKALNEWIQRLGDIFFCRNGAPSLNELRSRLLSAEELAAIELERKSDF